MASKENLSGPGPPESAVKIEVFLEEEKNYQHNLNDNHDYVERSLQSYTDTTDLLVKEETEITRNINDLSIDKYKDNILCDIALDDSIIKSEDFEEQLIESIEKTNNKVEDSVTVENNTVIIKEENHNVPNTLDEVMHNHNEVINDPNEVITSSDVTNNLEEYCKSSERIPTNIIVKLEEENLVSYDQPNFDGYGSEDENRMGHVEAFLEQDMAIKNEEDYVDDLHRQDEGSLQNMKQESDFVVTETQLISNKFINTTSTVTHCQDGITEAHTTQTLVMEIRSIPCDPPCHEEEILPSCNNPNINNFQLNSITGDILTLEQEAYGIMPKQKVERPYKCHRCIKTFKVKGSLKSHLSIHDSIDRYKDGVKKGLMTKELNKKIKMLEEIDSIQQQDEYKKSVKKEVQEYKCTCQQVYKRRTRMEACLKTHEGYAECSRYKCISCPKEFKSKDFLLQHRSRMHSRKKFLCKFCPTEHNTRKSLFHHLRKHQKVQLMEYKVVTESVKGKRSKCFHCNKVCADFTELKSHILNGHEAPFQCKKCPKKFRHLNRYVIHTKKSHPDAKRQSVLDVLTALLELAEEWKCEDCKLQFMEVEKLAMHKAEHRSQNPALPRPELVKCPDCHRMFATLKSLNSHRRIHENSVTAESQTGYLCVHCRKVCKDENTWTSHMRFHSPQRKFVCKFCDFRFATAEKRKTHAEIHTGDLKYVCFICEYQCSSLKRLRNHKSSEKHLSAKQILLDGPTESIEISKEEIINDNLRENEQEIKKRKENVSESDDSDSELTPCDVCGETFPSEAKMLKHKDTHPFIEFPNDDKPSRIFFK